MAKWHCVECGTEFITQNPDIQPTGVNWSDGHLCSNFELTSDPLQLQITQLKAEINDLKAELNPDDPSLLLGKLTKRLSRLEDQFRAVLGTKLLKNYGKED
jgi:hypothetical protein